MALGVLPWHVIWVVLAILGALRLLDATVKALVAGISAGVERALAPVDSKLERLVQLTESIEDSLDNIDGWTYRVSDQFEKSNQAIERIEAAIGSVRRG